MVHPPQADELICHSYYNIYSMSVTGLRFFTVYGPWGRPDMAAYKFAINIMRGKPITIFQVRRDLLGLGRAWDPLLIGMQKPSEGYCCLPYQTSTNTAPQGPEKSELKRDFTYIDDIVDGIMGALAEIPPSEKGTAHYKVRCSLDDLLCCTSPNPSGTRHLASRGRHLPVQMFYKLPAMQVYNLGNTHPHTVSEMVTVLEKHLGRRAIRKYIPVPPTGDVLATFADISSARKVRSTLASAACQWWVVPDVVRGK